MIDKYIIKFCEVVDKFCEAIANMESGQRCQCKKKKKKNS